MLKTNAMVLYNRHVGQCRQKKFLIDVNFGTKNSQQSSLMGFNRSCTSTSARGKMCFCIDVDDAMFQSNATCQGTARVTVCFLKGDDQCCQRTLPFACQFLLPKQTLN
mmetsp:Transcript_25211/g.69523  ORF Transcript_25211/g.69523 Transcript_25211/m.69523 type:complete len:108 (+) Transcript_25211:787-1110(+)